MNLEMENHRQEVSWGLSLICHAVLVLILAMQTVQPLPKPKILTIETIAGLVTPFGSGAGSVGQGKTIQDKPVSSPLSPGFGMNLADIPVRAVPDVKPKPIPQPQTAQVPVNPQPAPKPDLSSERQALPIGVSARSLRQGDELPEEGLGAGQPAGTSQGSPDIQGPIAGRGWRGPANWDFGRNLPEESTVIVSVVVKPNGLVSRATILRASGFREYDEFYLAKVREMVFDALPAGVEQVDEIGELTFKLAYEE